MEILEVISWGILDEGKTYNSTPRQTTMPPILIEDLKAWKKLLEATGHPTRPEDFIISGDLAGRQYGERDPRTDGCHYTRNQAGKWGPKYFTPIVKKVALGVEGMAGIHEATEYSLRRGGITARLRTEDPQTIAAECGTSFRDARPALQLCPRRVPPPASTPSRCHLAGGKEQGLRRRGACAPARGQLRDASIWRLPTSRRDGGKSIYVYAMREPLHLQTVEKCPHVIACSYESEETCLRAYQSLMRALCMNAGVMRIQTSTERQVVVACADDEAAGAYMARLSWGEATPMGLSLELCAAVVSRRAEGARRADRNGGRYARQGMSDERMPYESADDSTVRLKALNTAARPWIAGGGVSGALCSSAEEAFHIREDLVLRHLDDTEGMLVAFDRRGDSPLVAVIADDADTEQLAHEELGRLAGNMGYRPNSDEAWALWALRLTAGDASLPISFDGDFEALRSVLSGGTSTLRHVKAHAPTRNQLCPCGSGRKFKHCCGR